MLYNIIKNRYFIMSSNNTRTKIFLLNSFGIYTIKSIPTNVKFHSFSIPVAKFKEGKFGQNYSSTVILMLNKYNYKGYIKDSNDLKIVYIYPRKNNVIYFEMLMHIPFFISKLTAQPIENIDYN